MSNIDPSFALKEPNSQEETLIYMKVYLNYKRITLSTEKKIYPDLWDSSIGYPITDKKVLMKHEKDYPGISSKVTDIERTISNYRTALSKAITRLNILGEDYDQGVLKSQIQKELGHEPRKLKKVTLSVFIDSFVNDIETGRRLTQKGKPFTPGTIKNYKGFKVQFKAFQKDTHTNVDFNDVTFELKDRFVSYFLKKNYSPNTVWRHLKHLKSIMNVAYEEGLHLNMEFQRRKFMIPQVETSEVYLNEIELDTIQKLDLKAHPHLDLARDVFLVGCYTAQRYSDFSRITKEQIHFTPEGKGIIKLTQAKTGTPVVIPIMPALEKILKKYDYSLPMTYEQKVNKYIKEVVNMAEIDKQESDEVYINGRRTTESRPKYELVKTHTARRSGATNMFLAKVPVISIMRITGHKTEREFLKYIRITNQENANNLAEHPYFS